MKQVKVRPIVFYEKQLNKILLELDWLGYAKKLGAKNVVSIHLGIKRKTKWMFGRLTVKSQEFLCLHKAYHKIRRQCDQDTQ